MVAPLKFGIIGLGSIGLSVAKLAHIYPALVLAGVTSRDAAKATEQLSRIGIRAPVCALGPLINDCDILVEALPPSAFRAAVEPVLQAGKPVVVLSAASLLANWDLVALAEENGARIVLPSGAILALDAIRAATSGGEATVTVRSSKPPSGFVSTPYVVQNGIDVLGATAPMQLFSGTVREGGAAFPTSVNVAVAAALAGMGPDHTRLQIWADPNISRNVHEIELASKAANFTARIENIPSPDNPRTSSIVAQSVIATLLGQRSTIQFG